MDSHATAEIIDAPIGRTPAFIATLSALYASTRMSNDEIALELATAHPSEALMQRPTRKEVAELVGRLKLVRDGGGLTPQEMVESRQRAELERTINPLIEAQQRWLAEQALATRELVDSARSVAAAVLADPEASTRAASQAVETLDKTLRMVRRDWGIDRREALEDAAILKRRDTTSDKASGIMLDFHAALTLDQ
jgi:hypothetical protein